MLHSPAGALKYFGVLSSCAGLLVSIAFITKSAAQSVEQTNASPIYGVTIPAGYRYWQVVGVSHAPDEAGPGRIKAILGNPLAIKALREGTTPLPDGAMVAKVTWKAEQHPDWSNRTLSEPNAFIPGDRVKLQVMVKDTSRYASTGGWGYGEFVDGKPVGKDVHEKCAPCHTAGATSKQDFVFTRFAP